MNGPEHYAAAEKVLEYAESGFYLGEPENYANAMRNAQVHATLALAAATALQPWGASDVRVEEWQEVAR